MEQRRQGSVYDLEERTLQYSKDVIGLIRESSKSLSNVEIARQLVRAAGSVGANYIEANESLGKKDFLMHVRIARKEAKESRYWLQLLECDKASDAHRARLIQESTELLKILSAIIEKSL